MNKIGNVFVLRSFPTFGNCARLGFALLPLWSNSDQFIAMVKKKSQWNHCRMSKLCSMRLHKAKASTIILVHAHWHCSKHHEQGVAKNSTNLWFLCNKWQKLDWLGGFDFQFYILSQPPGTVFFIGPESDHWECLSVTHSLPNSVLFSKLDWCDPGVWRCQLKTCWGCYCCWCW